MAKNSMIDSDFIEEGDFDDEGKQGKEAKEERWTPPELDKVIRPETPARPKGLMSRSRSVTTTPDEDKGKWVADDQRDGEPDLPEDDEVRGYAKGGRSA
jgi:hypothetical protein